MMCDVRVFAPQIEAIGHAHEIVVPELTGASTLAGLADIVLQCTSASRLALAGLSMGGIVALAAAARAPERIARLALLDSNHKADAPERRAVRERQMAMAAAGGLRKVLAEELKPAYLASQNRENHALLDVLLSMGLSLGPRAFIDQSMALRDRPDQTEALARFPGPTLALCGAEDRLCPPERSREMAGLARHGTLEIIEGAGHISTLEQPRAVTEALVRWLKSGARAPQ